MAKSTAKESAASKNARSNKPITMTGGVRFARQDQSRGDAIRKAAKARVRARRAGGGKPAAGRAK